MEVTRRENESLKKENKVLQDDHVAVKAQV